MKLTRAARERMTQAPDSVWCIFDTHDGVYVQKKQHSGFMKTVWNSKGAAKLAAMNLIYENWERDNADIRYRDRPARVKHFKDQTRYEVHEMALKPVAELPRYFIDTDGDEHYFLIPVKRRDEWRDWKENFYKVATDDAPEWAKPIDGYSGVTFENPKGR